jgi:hypothetical protein
MLRAFMVSRNAWRSLPAFLGRYFHASSEFR